MEWDFSLRIRQPADGISGGVNLSPVRMFGLLGKV